MRRVRFRPSPASIPGASPARSAWPDDPLPCRDDEAGPSWWVHPSGRPAAAPLPSAAPLSKRAAKRLAKESALSSVASASAARLIDTAQASSKPWRLVVKDHDAFCELLESQQRAMDRAAPETTLNNEESNMRWFLRYCDNSVFSTCPVRPDVRRLSPDEYDLEVALWANAVPWLAARVPNRAGVAGMAKPSSVMAILRGVRRAHMRHNIDTVPLGAAVRRCDLLLRDYVAMHGPEALVPRRREPLTNPLIAGLLNLPEDTVLGPRSKVQWSHPNFSSLRAMFATFAQTGFRKAELSLAEGVAFGKIHASLANVRWLIGGKIYEAPTAEQLRSLSDGDFCLLTPPLSKSDQFGLHWGASTIYLRFYSSPQAHPICAAREMAAEELRRCVPPDSRRTAPLFVRADGSPWRHKQLSSIFHSMLVVLIGEDAAKNFSIHSFRIYLACALLAAGASHGTICAMLRWRSDDALRIYARINDDRYADELERAACARVSSVRTTTSAAAGLLGEMRSCAGGEVASREAGFQGYWQAVAATIAEADMPTPTELPAVDADSRVQQLNTALSSLAVNADRTDIEDRELLTRAANVI